MANKHWTTNAVVREERAAKREQAMRIRAQRQRALRERQDLENLRHKFEVRSGRTVVV